MKNLIVIILLAVFVSSCGSTANDEKPSVKYQEKKNSLEETERSNPLQFLKITNGNDHNNLVNKVVIEGTITNSATLVSYKDIEIGIIIKDEKGAVITKDKKTLNMTIGPNSTQAVKVKVKRPKGTSSVAFDITGATPVNK
jgi:hypothetical protein